MSLARRKGSRVIRSIGLSAVMSVVPILPSVEVLQESYTLVWSDEFEGDTLDDSKWSHRRLGPRREGITVEDAVSLDGQGHLVLTTRQVGDEYHTAMIGTQDKFETTFGYFETRVKFQTQEGHWSAFWLQSPTVEEVGDPQAKGVETDIFEYHARNHLLNMALHWGGYGWRHRRIRHRWFDASLSQGFHTFAVEWTPDMYVFYYNGQRTWWTKEVVSHAPQYIILSLEVGKWAGRIQRATLPDSLYVDYVRVFKQGS